MHQLFILETNHVSKADRQNLVDSLTTSGILSDFEFEGYLMKSLSNNMPMRNFENLARNIFNYSDLNVLKPRFADFMATSYLKNNFRNYFQHIVSFDKKRFAVESLYWPDLDIVLAIVDKCIYHVSHSYRQEDALQILKVLSKDTSIKYHQLLCYLGEAYWERGEKVRVLLMVDGLELFDKYELLAMSLYRKSLIWEEVENSLSDDRFFEYTKERLQDDDLLCQAMRNHNVYGDFFHRSLWNGHHLLFRAMIEAPEKIPQTLEYILQNAIENSQFDVIIQLGACFPKRRILEIITSQNNTDLIDKFFFLYKDYPEIKKLTPFI